MVPLRLEARKVAKRFGARAALRGVDVEAREGEVLAVLGPSGAGKTTLLRILALLLEPDEGHVSMDGKRADPSDPAVRRRLGWVGQRPLVFRQSTIENVVYGLRARGAPPHEVHSSAMTVMERLGLWELRAQPARALSGGEQQRVAFARALVLGPDALLLDEFTANLDPGNAGLLEQEVRRLAAQGTTIVASTHDLFLARRIADRVLFLHRGQALEEAPAKQFFEAPASTAARAFVRGDLPGLAGGAESY